MKNSVFYRKAVPVLLPLLTLICECLPWACTVCYSLFDAQGSETIRCSYFATAALNYAGMFPLVAGVLTALMFVSGLLRLWEPSASTDRFYLLTAAVSTLCCAAVCVVLWMNIFSVLPLVILLLAGLNIYVALTVRNKKEG